VFDEKTGSSVADVAVEDLLLLMRRQFPILGMHPAGERRLVYSRAVAEEVMGAGVGELDRLALQNEDGIP